MSPRVNGGPLHAVGFYGGQKQTFPLQSLETQRPVDSKAMEDGGWTPWWGRVRRGLARRSSVTAWSKGKRWHKETRIIHTGINYKETRLWWVCGVGNHKGQWQDPSWLQWPCYHPSPDVMRRGRAYWNLEGQREFVYRASCSNLAGDMTLLKWPQWEGTDRRNTLTSLSSFPSVSCWGFIRGQRAQEAVDVTQEVSFPDQDQSRSGWAHGRYLQHHQVRDGTYKRWYTRK